MSKEVSVHSSTGGASPGEFPTLRQETLTSDDDTPQGLWSLVNDRLTGRWKFAIPLGIILAALAATAGYHSTEPKYESSGMIRIAPKITPIMRDTAETGVMPFYSNYVQTQSRLIGSQRVIERALQHLDLSALPWGSRNQALREIQRGVSVRADRQSELIMISFQSDSAIVSQTVVNAIIRAYDELYGSVDGDEFGRKLQTLRNLREDLRNQRRQKRAQIQDLISSTEYAVADFNELIQQTAMTIHRYEAELRELERQIAIEFERNPELAAKYTGDGDVNDGDEDAQAGESDEALTMEPTDRELEAFDRELDRLGQTLSRSRTEYERAQGRFMPQHRGYQNAEREYLFHKNQYEQRAARVREEYLAFVARNPEEVAGGGGISHMLHRVELLKEEIGRQRSVAREMSQKQLSLNDYRAEESDIEQDLAEVNARIRDLEIESDAIRHGRITVAQLGDRPTAPNRDQRKARAMLGLVGGMGAGLGLFFLLGTIDRRTYSVSQFSDPSLAHKLLGILPALNKQSEDLADSAIAAHCVHQIRNHLESDMRGLRQSPVITITSPAAGDGKTSLTFALGMSYAIAGYRTLMIDGDIVGQSLTYQSRMQTHVGFREALRHRAVNEDHISDLPSPNLFIMPTGCDSSFGPEMVRRSDMEVLLKALRKSYDVILIDTGPLTGSVESLPIALASDGTVLTMWRGGRRSRLEECISMIHRSGARFTGMVLNYARSSDCSHYVSKSNVSFNSAVHHADEGNGFVASDERAERARPNNRLLQAMRSTQESRE